VNHPGPGPRPPGWRTAKAAASGVLAGVGALVLARATLGRDVVIGGTFIGLAAMAAGASGSLFLTGRRRHRGRPAARRGRVHPVSWFTPVVGSVVTVVAWALVAHSSGSGWVQAVGVLMAAVLAVGIVGPALPARRASVTCTSCPSDGQAGRPVLLTLRASGPMRITPRRPKGAPTEAAGAPRGTRTAEVRLMPARRGVAASVVLELATCAPFGLLWWAKEVDVALPRPLHVAPRPTGPGPIGSADDPSPGGSRRWVPAGTGEPRATRPYQPGDRRGSVHWPSTSHVGSLMVREREHLVEDPVVIELVLPPDAAEAEAVAGRALTVVAGHLARGRTVLLGTLEPDGHHRAPVRDRVDLGRRLARAVAAPVRTPPAGDDR